MAKIPDFGNFNPKRLKLRPRALPKKDPKRPKYRPRACPNLGPKCPKLRPRALPKKKHKMFKNSALRVYRNYIGFMSAKRFANKFLEKFLENVFLLKPKFWPILQAILRQIWPFFGLGTKFWHILSNFALFGKNRDFRNLGQKMPRLRPRALPQKEAQNAKN